MRASLAARIHRTSMTRWLCLAFLLPGVPAPAQPTTTTLIYPPWKHCYGLHRVTQSHLTLRAGFKYRFENPQGMSATKLQAEDDTTTTRDDDELTVFGVNSGQHMLIYNTSITSIAFYGGEGRGEGEFQSPHDVSADRDGNVVVSDTGNDRLHVLFYQNDRLHHVRFIAGEFDGLKLERPLGVTLEAGEIYVCDPENDRLLVLSLEGRLLRSLKPEVAGVPVLKSPYAVAVIRRHSEFNFFDEDFIVVSDSSNQRLLQLAQDGGVLQIRRVGELARNVQRFDHVAIDYHANVYASDLSGRLHKFDRHLQYLLSIGRPGQNEYEFDEPRGLGLYRRFGQLFVAERRGAQYLWTGTDVFSPTLIDLQPGKGNVWSAHVRFFLTEYARVRLDLVDADDVSRVAIQQPRWTAPGLVESRLRFQLPEEVPDGLRLQVQAIPTYSARKYLVVEKRTAPLTFPRAEESR